MIESGIESYCPLNKVRRKWSDRIKVVEEPLFKSFVFVKVDDSALSFVRLTEGVINFVYWNGKLAKIADTKIQAIKQFLSTHEQVELVKTTGTIDGLPVVDVDNIHKEKRTTTRLSLKSIGYTLLVPMNQNKLIYPLASK